MEHFFPFRWLFLACCCIQRIDLWQGDTDKFRQCAASLCSDLYTGRQPASTVNTWILLHNKPKKTEHGTEQQTWTFLQIMKTMLKSRITFRKKKHSAWYSDMCDVHVRRWWQLTVSMMSFVWVRQRWHKFWTAASQRFSVDSDYLLYLMHHFPTEDSWACSCILAALNYYYSANSIQAIFTVR